MKNEGPGFLRRLLNTLKNKTSSVYLSMRIAIFLWFIVGIIALAGFNAGMESTNTLEFCIGCHSTRDNVFNEYKQTAHYSNRTGVRAICSDCQVSKDWAHKVMCKIRAANDVYGTIIGTVDTKEKFEAKRMEMARNEWNEMKANNSRECRSCHNFEAMKSSKQKPRAQENHAQAQKEGKTCIDCHKGIAHLLPKEYHDPTEEE